MAEFFLELTSSIFARFILNLTIFAICLWVISLFDRQPKSMGRLIFGLLYVFVASALFSLPYVWAVVATYDVDAATLAYIGFSFVALLLLAFGARRRSLDAYGHLDNSFFAAIPLVNLILLFKYPMDARTANRSIFSLVGRIAVFVVCAFLVILPASAFVGLMQESILRPNLTNISVERSARLNALITDSQAPKVIDAVTLLMGAESNGRQLILNYRLLEDINQSIDLFRSAMSFLAQHDVCSDPNTRYLIEGGGEVKFRYDLQRNANETVDIVISSCLN